MYYFALTCGAIACAIANFPVASMLFSAANFILLIVENRRDK